MNRSFAIALVFTCACGSSNDPPTFDVVLDHLPGAVLSFWGQSTDDLFAVGGDLGDPGEELILHYDGATWSRMQADAPTLWWVHGFGPDDVWAVGEHGTIVHYDGSGWTTVHSSNDYTLWGIWGAAPDDLWAVGGSVTHAVPSIVLHYDGSTWSEVSELARDGDMYFKIWGSSASDIWTVSEKGFAVHYDGSTWTAVDSGAGTRLITVTGRAADDVYAVGGVTSSVLLHYDGSDWQPIDVDLSGGLMGVWAGPDQQLFVTGFSGIMALSDGEQWTPLPFVTPDCLHATWGDGNGVILGGGGNLVSASGGDGVIVGTGDIAGGPVTGL